MGTNKRDKPWTKIICNHVSLFELGDSHMSQGTVTQVNWHEAFADMLWLWQVKKP